MSNYNRHRKGATAVANDDSDDDPSNESFILYGTEFPEPTEKERRQGIEDPGKFQPVWNQQVTDEKGRRRFHGAFTGGYSAGYYNTVGSKEGWQPSTFVSSRATRQDKSGAARPEDFMDEEDLNEIANARKLVATEEFDLLGGTERELAKRREMDKQAETDGGLLGSHAFQDFVIPSKDPIGVKLLRKMGWKPGQGVGARISAAKRRKLVMENSESESEEDYDADITFAPRDSAIIVFAQKRDTFGLGFDPYKNVPDIADIKRARADRDTTQDSGRDSSYNKVGFGVGVLDDDDDDEVYNDVSSTNYASELYDDDFDNDDRITIGRRQKDTSRTRRYKESRESINRTGHDGRLPISGFEHGKSDILHEKWFAPPQVPVDFKPIHVFSDPGPIPEKETVADKTARPDLSFEERGNLLGEKPIATRSVFDYVSSKSKDRLDNLLTGITRPVSNVDKTRLNDISRVEKKDALTALRGFLPFGENPKKQARYRAYLEGQAGLLNEDGSAVLSMDIPQGLTYDEAQKELDDFCKAARIFRPISGMMSSRFTSASQTATSSIQTGEGGLRTESQWKKEKDEREKREKEEKEQAPKVESQEAQAAAMKMFGQLTRTTKPFYPSRLVCKRFNVKNPHPDKQADDAAGRRTQAGAKQPLSKESVRTMMNNNTLDEFTSTPDFANDPIMQAVIPKPSDRGQQEQLTTQTIAQTTSEKAITNTVEEKQESPLDYERPSMDIFKAIFEDSDEDDDEEDEREREPEPMSTLAHQTTSVDNEMADDSNVIGPPLPPAPEEESKPVFRPMFKKRTQDRQIKDENASSRSVHVGPMSFISSEEHVVEPFSKTSSDNSRREQKRSRRDDSDQESSEERRRSSSRTHHHKKESKKKKRKSDRSHSRERRHKKSKKRRRERSDSEIDPDEIAERLVYDDSLWVEKPAVAAPVKTRQAESSSKARPKAYDMW